MVMRANQKKELPKAVKIFTDRLEPRKAFWDNYVLSLNNLQDDGYTKVLTYYGIGGIGKSSLLNELMKEIDEQMPQLSTFEEVYHDASKRELRKILSQDKIKYAVYNFDHSQLPEIALSAIKNQLSTKYGFKFDMFDWAMFFYKTKLGFDASSPDVKSYVDSSSVLRNCVNILSVVPVWGLPVKILDQMDKLYAKCRSWGQAQKNEIIMLNDYSVQEIATKLPYYFACDLKRNLENATMPLVIFLDTYEKLVNEMINGNLDNDKWLRDLQNGLILNSSKVLWVFAGRERLKWKEEEPDWEGTLEQHRIGNLSEIDANTFMEAAGITNDNLRLQLYALTHGTPIYLDICVDRYMDLQRKGTVPTIDDFGKNTRELVERFAKYMDDTRRDVVYYLACLGQWTDDMIEKTATKCLGNFSWSAYDVVKKFSFISKSENVYYKMHQTVGDVFITYCPTQVRNYALEEIPKYFVTLREKMNQYSYECYEAFLNEYIFLSRHFKRNNLQVIEAREQVGLSLFEIGKYAEAMSFEEDTLMLRRQLQGEKHPKTIITMNNLVLIYRELGNYKKAKDYGEKVFNLQKEISGEYHVDTITAMNNLVLCYNSLGEYEKANKLAEKTYALSMKLFGEKNEKTIIIASNLALSYGYVGLYEKAKELVEKNLRLDREIFGDKSIGTVVDMNNLALYDCRLGRYQEAKNLLEKVLKLYIIILGEKHPTTMTIMSNLADVYGMIGEYEKGEKLFIDVLNLSREICGRNHPDTIMRMNSLAILYNDLGEYEKAKELLEHILPLCKELFGENHPCVINVISTIANNYRGRGLYENAKNMSKKALLLSIKVLGEEHPDTIVQMNNLATFQCDLGEYEDAKMLLERVLDLDMKIYGEKHPDTIMAMNNLARSYIKKRESEKAKIILEKALILSSEVSGDRCLNTVMVMNNLAYACDTLGDYGKAKLFFEKALEFYSSKLGDKHPDTITIMDNLAHCYNHSGENNKAIELLNEVLLFRKRILGEKHPYTIRTIFDIGNIYFSLNDKQKTTELLLHARKLYSECQILSAEDKDNKMNQVDDLLRKISEQ